MKEKSLTKVEEHVLNQERFKKTPQEREDLKAAKAAWKKANQNGKAKG